MAKTIILGKTPYRVLRRDSLSISLQPVDSEYPQSLLLRDPPYKTAEAPADPRWGHSFRGNRDVTWYRQISDDVFERAKPQRAHSTIASKKIPSFKISTKVPAAMTAAEINKELDKLDDQDSTLGRLMIDAGRGHERPSEYLKLTDPLSSELRKNADRRQDLRIEISFRYGPNPPSRLPTGRGFGPRSKTRSPTSGGLGFGKRHGGD